MHTAWEWYQQLAKNTTWSSTILPPRPSADSCSVWVRKVAVEHGQDSRGLILPTLPIRIPLGLSGRVLGAQQPTRNMDANLGVLLFNSSSPLTTIKLASNPGKGNYTRSSKEQGEGQAFSTWRCRHDRSCRYGYPVPSGSHQLHTQNGAEGTQSHCNQGQKKKHSGASTSRT